MEMDVKEMNSMPAWNRDFKLTPDYPPNDGIMFVNHEPEGRSGHMGHALVEYAPGQILAFYPNCSSEDPKLLGHSGYGWMEYKRSTDGGDTWSDPMIEPNSKALFDQHCGRTMMCEKAVCTDNGTIVLFYVTCDMVVNGHIWEPYYEPRYAILRNAGAEFSEARMFDHRAGRIYDAVCHEGKIYVLFYDNAELPGIAHLQEHPYRLYVSEDDGETFVLRGKVPFQSTIGCYYGTMAFTPEGKLIVYIYDEHDENNLKYIVSEDEGRTWGVGRRAFFEKGLRNPQLIRFGGSWWIHGRSGNAPRAEDACHFILYHSDDAIHWDEGCCLRKREHGAGAYSNSLVVHRKGMPDRLLIQTSHAYSKNKTNIIMWYLDIRDASPNASLRR